jgi:hypothetical protein
LVLLETVDPDQSGPNAEISSLMMQDADPDQTWYRLPLEKFPRLAALGLTNRRDKTQPGIFPSTTLVMDALN